MKLYKRVGKLVAPQWPTLAAAVACMVLVAGMTAALAWLVQPLLDDIFISASDDPERAARMMVVIPLAFVAAMAIKGAAGYGEEVLMNRVGQRIIAQLREMIYAHLQRLSLSFYDHASTGLLISRVTNEVQLLQDAVSRAAVGVVRDALSIVGLMGVIFYRDWKLALMSLFVFPLAMIPFLKFGRWARKFAVKRQESTAEMSNLLQETITGARVVKAFAGEEHEISRFESISQRLLKVTMSAVRVNAMTSPVMESLGGLGMALILGYGGYQVINGQATPGTFFSFITALILLYEPIKKVAIANNHIQQGLAAAGRIFETLDTQPDVVDRPGAVELAPIKDRIEFCDVHFTYDREPVLNGVSLTVKAGQIVALAGSSGGGKTTLVNLLPRFYDVDSGAVKIDGVDTRDVTIESLRRQIGLVTQQIILFNDTIRNNIAYGKPNATEEEIYRAAEAAYAHEFITALPEGYDTVIGEQGVRLSGGQRQRLAIARALLKDAPILILDEATSSLDTESEFYVQKAIDNLMRGRTVLVIAHRLSTIQHADRIVIMADGKIIEEGTHDELMACGGEYCKLYRMQFAAD